MLSARNVRKIYLIVVWIVSVQKIQETPPLYKFVYNRNLYNIFWQPLEIYINDLENFIINKFKSKVVGEIAPIARFCIFNNPQLRNYLSKYAACTNDSCDLNMKDKKEPEAIHVPDTKIKVQAKDKKETEVAMVSNDPC